MAQVPKAQAKDVMVREVITVGKDFPVDDAIHEMVENNITGLPVVNDDMTLAGIVTEKDLIRLLRNKDEHIKTVEDFMTLGVVTFGPEASLEEICDCFMENNFRRVPIIDGNDIVGIISRGDIIKFLHGECDGSVDGKV